MPSEADRLDLVGEALGRLWTDYKEAAALGADEVDGLLRSTGATAEENGRPAFAATLGSLGSAYFDVDRLAPLLAGEAAPEGQALEAMKAAGAVLREIAREPDPCSVNLPAGGSLADAVEGALARLGRAFGAAHVVALARAGRYEKKEHHDWLASYPFFRWTRRERQRVPPLVVTLVGADLRAGGLAEFLDGRMKLVLLGRDDTAPPAPLVRLTSPGIYLAQTHDGAQLKNLSAWSGPGIVAWVPESSAAFVHDPAAGPALGARIQMLSEASAPRRGLGGLSAAQLADELRQLEALASATMSDAALAGRSNKDPVDRLAAWILSQANVADDAAKNE